jgi:hypothetical protein
MLTATPIDGVTMTPVDIFEGQMTNIIGGLATSLPNAQILVLNLFGDARWVPFASSIPNSVDVPGLGTVTLMGEDGELTAGDRLTLAASELIALGYGLPVPGAPPLPENLDLATGAPGVILREAELDAIADRAAAFNAIIEGTAAMFPNVHVFDVNPVLSALSDGTYRTFGGVELTAELLVGGIYSYDGVHPQNVGHGVVAYELIEFLNAELGAGLDQINMYDVLTEGDWQTPTPLGGAKDAQLTREAFLQIYRLFAPELAERWDRSRRVDTTATAAID